jgi:hypothetical protein
MVKNLKKRLCGVQYDLVNFYKPPSVTCSYFVFPTAALGTGTSPKVCDINGVDNDIVSELGFSYLFRSSFVQCFGSGSGIRIKSGQWIRIQEDKNDTIEKN